MKQEIMKILLTIQNLAEELTEEALAGATPNLGHCQQVVSKTIVCLQTSSNANGPWQGRHALALELFRGQAHDHLLARSEIGAVPTLTPELPCAHVLSRPWGCATGSYPSSVPRHCAMLGHSVQFNEQYGKRSAR